MTQRTSNGKNDQFTAQEKSMTDRIHSITVILEKELREDDAQEIISAILCLKGVLTVRGNTMEPGWYAAREQVRRELKEKLWEILS